MRMQLGDMEMDSESGLSFGGDNDRPSEPNTSQIQVLDREIPELHPAIFATACLLSSGLTVGFSLAIAFGVLPLLTLGAILPFASFAILAGFLTYKSLSDGQVEASNPGGEVDNDVAERRARQLTDFLGEHSRPLTVEDIGEELGWTEEAVVSGLAELVDRGEVHEQLDEQSNHWKYRLPETDEKTTLGLGEPEEEYMPVQERAQMVDD